MAIGALQLHRAAWSAQVFFEMHLVIELDSPGIRIARPQRREFRMAIVKSANFGCELRFAVRGLQIRVALRASANAGAGQPKNALVLYMAVGARWRECLIGVMDWTVVTGQAGLIGRTFLISRLRDVAGAAFLAEQRVGVRQRPGSVWLRRSHYCIPAEPCEA